MQQKIPTIILTGFLGAGKTTLLNRLIDYYQSTRTVLLINEFGQVGIDGQLLAAGNYQKIELNKGSLFCICVRTDFIDEVERIATEMRPELLIIEATGLADLPTKQKVRLELWDMGSSESSKLTYDDIKAMLGGEDGIPHTGMDERSWNSEKHAYGWFNGEGDYYVLYFVVRDGDEYYTAATFSSSVRGDS